MIRARNVLGLFAALLAVGCNGDANLNGIGGGPGAVEELFPEYNGAILDVTAPVSGDIYLRDEGVPFEARIVGADGNLLDFDQIVWETDQEPGTEIYVGTDGEEFVNWGIHLITATADLPNGDRLVYAAGGIRVQGEHTGIYSGNLHINLSAEFQGTPISGSCNGGLDFTVDMSGTLLDGGGECTVDLLVLGQFDVSYNLDASVFEDDAEGDIGVDVGFFEIPIEWDGEFEDEDRLIADFSGGAFLFDMDGEIDAHKVSPYVDP